MGILDRCLPAAMLLKDDGSKIYSRTFLWIYDFNVLWLNNNYAWRCSTDKVLFPLYRSAMGANHLEIGVGTGYYPTEALKLGTPCRRITLVDLNAATLDAASRRISGLARDSKNTSNNTSSAGSGSGSGSSGSGSGNIADVELRTVLANAMEPLPLPAGETFDSISLFHLLHCVPLTPEQKTRVFDLVRERLRASGTLVGSTILGDEVPRNRFAEFNMRVYNKSGVFHNWADTRAVFERGLRRNFEDVETDVVGSVMTWRARKPRPG
ncbi:hypothetical protein ESCO_005641 [Escovopsis weberi]|uniref:Uncharacterized protein n=1 Tax=Escovopsis weberi TaxID=150374 RepID=A0A0M9VUJ1_ESCWE|nr:hypothetical protein ESCO_005641 [Escovopsis weberi]